MKQLPVNDAAFLSSWPTFNDRYWFGAFAWTTPEFSILPFMNMLRALATVSAVTLISRITGFIRDVVFARVFGAGLYTDAFFVAFTIPNLLRRLFAEGALSQAFVPVLAEYKNRGGREAIRELISHTAAFLGLALLVIVVIGVIAAPLLVPVFAPGFVAIPDKSNITVEMLRIVFPYIFLIALAARVYSDIAQYLLFDFRAGLFGIMCIRVLAPGFYGGTM